MTAVTQHYGRTAGRLARLALILAAAAALPRAAEGRQAGAGRQAAERGRAAEARQAAAAAPRAVEARQSVESRQSAEGRQAGDPGAHARISTEPAELPLARLGPDGGSRVGARDERSQDGGTTRVDVGGYGSFRLELNGSDAVPTSFTLRRFVVTTDAHVLGRLQVYSEVEYERLTEIELEQGVESGEDGLEFEQAVEGSNESELALEQAWAQLELFGGLGVRMGAVLPPIGRFNLRHDDNLWDLPRRPLTDRAARVLPASAAWTELGLGVVGEAYVGAEGRLSWQLYLLNGMELGFELEHKAETAAPVGGKMVVEAKVSPRSGAFDGSNSADAVAGRIQFSPALGLELALSAYRGSYTPEYLGTDAVLTTFGIDGSQRIGGFQVEGEALLTRYGRVGEVARAFASAAVAHEVESSGAAGDLAGEVEVELSDLADRRYGFWVDVSRPIALDLASADLPDATVTPIIRYERVWIDDEVHELDFARGAVTSLMRGDVVQERISVGVAFRPVPQAVVHLAWERNRAVEGDLIEPAVSDGTTNGLVLGLAVGF